MNSASKFQKPDCIISPTTSSNPSDTNASRTSDMVSYRGWVRAMYVSATPASTFMASVASAAIPAGVSEKPASVLPCSM